MATTNAYDDFVEPWKTRFITEWETEIAAAKKHLIDRRGQQVKAKELALLRAKLPKLVAEMRQMDGVKGTPELIDGVMRNYQSRIYETKKRMDELTKLVDPKFNESQVKAASVRLESLEKNQPLFLGGATNRPLREWKEGAFGKSKQKALVIAISNADTVVLGNFEDPLVEVKGIPTKGLSVGKAFEFAEEFIVVKGSTAYTTASGQRKAVLSAEAIPLDTIRQKRE